MLSFIVIGKNEGWRLELCLTAIQQSVNNDGINDYEIIYIDSKSNDNSLKIAARFNNIRCFLIDGYCNAAIARNIGAKESKGNILFFIDGDMEIRPGFIPEVIKRSNLIYPFVSGIWINRYYDNRWNYLFSRASYNINHDIYEKTTGGLFLIARNYWEELHGMDTRLDRHQDLDFGLRMSKRGYQLLRKPMLLAIHHTTAYSTRSNSLSYYKNTGYLLRKHFFSTYFIKSLVFSNYTISILIISIVLSSVLDYYYIFIYLIAISYRSLKMKKQLPSLNFFSTFGYNILRDLVTISSFFFYYPSKKECSYHKV
jgi:glycosyltransferase involved in cell wall biosynthesis